MLCCLRFFCNGNIKTSRETVNVCQNIIQLDTTSMGHEVVVLKKGCRICGSGGAVATAPLVQSKSYFEIKIQQSGHWSVGLATLKADLNTSRGGKDNESWCLGSDNIVLHDNAELHKLTVKTDDVVDSTDSSAVTVTVPGTNSVETGIPTEGDIIGIAYDHVELNFYLNGKNLEVPVLGVKGTVYPVLFVDDGAILDLILDEFCYGPPPGFNKIMLEQSLL